MARIRHALIDVHLATRSFISLKTLALEGAFGVEAAAAVFTGVGAYNIKHASCHVLGHSCIIISKPKERNSGLHNLPREHSSMSRLQAEPL